MNGYNLLCATYLVLVYRYVKKISAVKHCSYYSFQGETCCWVCDDCKPWEFMLDKFKCEECELGFWPNTNFTGCYELPLQVHTYDIFFPEHNELKRGNPLLEIFQKY